MGNISKQVAYFITVAKVKQVRSVSVNSFSYNTADLQKLQKEEKICRSLKHSNISKLFKL